MQVTEIPSSEHEQILHYRDDHVGLNTIVAIHDTSLGPALGGCRFWPYDSEELALVDVKRLSRGMSFKAAAANLPLGGGKAVIIGDPKKLKSEAFFRSFGRFIESLEGRYITAEDVNIQVKDMDHVACETRYVTGISKQSGGSGDPAPLTALGVFHGIRAATLHKLRTTSLSGLRIAVQGCGAVGSKLISLLTAADAEVFVSDINKQALASLDEPVTFVDNRSIHKLKVDVYAPCALGACLNDETIPDMGATIIAGAANNQLQKEEQGLQALNARGILFAPDFIINAGGLINVFEELKGYNHSSARKSVEGIFDTLIEVFHQSEVKGISTLKAAHQMAHLRIARGKTDLCQTYDNQDWILR